MAFCATCGKPIEGKTCDSCGEQDAGFVLEENVACAMCYLLFVLTGVLFLLLPPYNQSRKIRFHALQSILFWAACVASGFLFTIVSLIVARIPLFGFLLILLTSFCLALGIMFLWLMMMYRAYQGQVFVLPVLGPLARKKA